MAGVTLERNVKIDSAPSGSAATTTYVCTCICGLIPSSRIMFRLFTWGCLTFILWVCILPARLPLLALTVVPRIVLTQTLHHLRRSHGVSESKQLDVCYLKHISPLPQGGSLVDQVGSLADPLPSGADTSRSGRKMDGMTGTWLIRA